MAEAIPQSSDHSQGIVRAKIGGIAEAIANLTEGGVLESVIATTSPVFDAIAIGEVKQDPTEIEG